MRADRVLQLTLTVSVVGASIAASLEAQLPTPPVAADTACTYERCSLWLDRGALVQGAHAAVVARSGFFRPVHVLPFVAGDSARRYAALYERNARRASRLSVAAVTLLAAGIVVGLSADCETIMPLPGLEVCEDDASGPIAAGLVLGGYTLELVSVLISSRGHRSLVRALWWHNGRYAR